MANWTSEQQKVIDTRGKNILVSAAAGSGKTAVLVERIIKKIIDKEHPLDVSKLLVATFTNAASAEMRERIMKAIEAELIKEPDNTHLQKQMANVYDANITTIHGFCLGLIKEHFNDVDLDPSVKIADDGEIRLMRSDVIKAVLEEYYAEGSTEFHNFISQFESKNSDAYIEEMILSIYNKSMKYPMPEEWLDNCAKKYDVGNEDEVINSKSIEFLNDYAEGVLRECVNQYKYMIDMCNDIDGPSVYSDLFTREKEELIRIMEEKDFNRRKTKLNISFDRLPSCKKDSCNPDIKDIVVKSRNECKDSIKKLREKIYFQDTKEIFEEIVKCKPIIEMYVEVTKTFIKKFKEKKLEKNLIDFNDFEHYAIDILVKKENGKTFASAVADELAKNFDEVMIDEYQDSNLVQETILSSISKGRYGIFNRFMVGDVKQSIYGFRGANPDIFIEKYNKYKKDDSDSHNCKIVLDKNFRSRKGIITTTNFIFKQIMNEKLGGINYDIENQLNYGAIFKECINPELCTRIDDKSELILINTEVGNEDAKVLEARVIAARIKELVNKERGMVVYDKSLDDYRPAKYSDIVILVRNISAIGDVLNDECMRYGVPCHMESKSGYFKTIEIRTIMNYLKIIDNPMQDIPLASVLKSPMVGLNDEELAYIRLAGGKKISLYENIVNYIDYSENTEVENDIYFANGQKLAYDKKLKEKLAKFKNSLNEYRVKTLYMSIYDLLCDVLEGTGYNDYVTAMPSGDTRKANIEMLKSKAKDYENSSYKGLFNFIRYIDKLNKYEIDMGEASIVSETDDAVRIMTIHKSKGLEFPIVFIANMSKQFNFSDTRAKAVVDSDFGIGMDYIDKENRIKTKNVIKTCINTKIQLEIVEEEMRLLYVACTRAKEKLIFTASGIDENRLKKMVGKRMDYNEYLGYGTLAECKSLLDFIAYGIGRNKSFRMIYREILGMDEPLLNPQYLVDSNIIVKYVGMDEIFAGIIKEKVNEDSNAETLKNLPTEVVYSDIYKKGLEERINYKYAFDKEVHINAKMSVSEIKKISYETEQSNSDEAMTAEEFILSIDEIETKKTTVPTFLESEEEIKGAARGTAYHIVFENYDFTIEPTFNNIEKMVDKMHTDGRLSLNERAAIDINDIVKFANSKLGIRMKKAYERGELYREAQFVMGISESKVEEFRRIAEIAGRENVLCSPQNISDEGDTILIQGVIDVYFIEDGKVIIADYKTDNIRELKELVNHYFVQIELYKMAVEQITGKEVKEKILYSVKLSEEIQS